MLRMLLALARGGGSFPAMPNAFAGFYNGKQGSDPQQLYHITTTDAGVTWTIGNGGSPTIPVGAGGTWNDSHVAHPSVVLEGATYALYASGYDGANWRIGRWTASSVSATPGDWTADAGNPIITIGTGGDPDDVGAYVPACQYDADTGITRIWYLGYEGTTFSVCYAERSAGGTITKYGQMLAPGAGGTWNEMGVAAGSPHTVGSEKRLYLGGLAASTVSSVGYATYTDPRVAATYTDQGQVLAGPIVVSDGSYDSVAITSVIPRGSGFVILGTLVDPTGSLNQREIGFRSTTVDGVTFSAPVGIFGMSTVFPAVESRENPGVLAI